MTPKLSTEMQSAIQAHPNQPLEVIDDAGRTYMLIPKATFIHLNSLNDEAEATTRDELKKLIQDGIDSGEGIPAEVVFAELRQIAAALDAKS